MHRLGELIMQWPSESEAKTTEPGQRVAMVWALCTEVSTCCVEIRLVGSVREELTFEVA